MKNKNMKKYNIIEENKCELPQCDCGWNIIIGGYLEEDLLEIKKFIHYKNTGCDGNENICSDCPE